MKLNFLRIYSLLLFLVAAATLSYFFFAEDILRWLHSGDAPQFLTELLRGRAENPLEFYLVKLSIVFFKVMSVLFFLLAVIGCLLLAHRFLGVTALLFNLFAVLFMFELSAHVLLKNPEWAKSLRVSGIVRPLYSTVRNTIQAMPKMAVYDDELSYTLREGKFIFDTVEFSTDYDVNRAGLRDDQDSLLAPSIIALGDSFTMGWGVESEETFASRLEQRLDRKTLNAGISSYGTARELLLLERLNRDALRTVILQYYVGNDYLENKWFVSHGFKQIPNSREVLRSTFDGESDRKKYSPLKYTFYMTKLFVDVFKEKLLAAFSLTENKGLSISPPTLRDKASTMLDIIERSILKEYEDVEIVLIALDEEKGREDFTSEVCKLIEAKKGAGVLGRIRPVSVMQLLDEADYFIYDDHLNVSGHAKIAEILAEVLTTPAEIGGSLKYCPK